MLATCKRIAPYFLAAIAIIGIHLGGLWTFAGILILFVIHPVLDKLIGRNALFQEELSNKTLNALTLIYVPFQLLFLIYCAREFSLATTWVEMIGITLTCGVITGGLGITVAHELVHRSNAQERGAGIFLLMMVNYAHFRVEHVFGHHRHVSTPQDPASARINQSIYEFLPQSIWGSWKSAVLIDWKRMRELTLIQKILANRSLQYFFVSLLVSFILLFFQSASILVFWWAQSFMAILLLEIINYIEHYGLSRKKIGDNSYEGVSEWHSWDCDYQLTNLTLFNLGRHSHHHAQASVPYWNLKNAQNVPTLPFGYSLAILIALVPPLWKKVMNPLVLARN
jgi:alkane 1-monooxygenase